MEEKPNKRSIGKGIEKYVAAYLQRIGYKIVHLNWTGSFAELDIIALDRLSLVFVEVKYSGYATFNPLLNITPRKLLSLRRSMGLYLHTVNDKPWFKGIRLDVIGVSRQKSGKLYINHLKNISTQSL